jgi:hypothetical protein
MSHNHFLFRRNAIDACLELGAWQDAEHHASALEDYARKEPLPWSSFVIARGHALAELGRGTRSADLRTELQRLLAEGERLGCLMALSAVRAALAQFSP